MDDLAKLGIKVDASEADSASKLLDKLTTSAKGTATSAELVESAFKKLAAVLGPAVIAHYLLETASAAYELQEKYHRLSEVAATLPSNMAALDLPARLAGTSLDSVAQAVARLSRAVGEAQAGGPQKSILKALGVDINNSGQDPVERFVQLGKVIMGMGDASVQAYASQMLLGRSFAEMRPVLKEIIEQGGLHKTLTDEEIRAAKEFQDTLTKLTFELEQGKIKMANDYLPQLKDVAQSFRDGYQEGGLLLGVLKAIATWQTGSDLHMANKEIFSLTDKLVEAQQRLQKLRYEDAQNKDKERPDFNKESINQLDTYIKELQKALDARRQWRQELEHPGSTDMGTTKRTPDGMDNAAIDSIIAEANLKRQMENKRLYEQRVADVKGFVDQYSAAIDTLNALVKERYKRNEITEAEQTQALAENEKARLTSQALAFKQLEGLAKGVDEQGKAREAAQGLAKVNAQIVGNEAVTAAQLSSISYLKLKAYQDFYSAALKGGEEVYDATKTEEQREQESYQRRKEQLEVFLAENRDMNIDAQNARESLETAHQYRLLQIEQQKHQSERSMQMATFEAAVGLLQLFEGKNKAAALAVIAIQKAMAIAQVIQQTAVASAAALTPPPVGLGPVAGAGLAASIQAWGAAQIGLIAATGLVQAYQATQGTPSGGSGGFSGGGPTPVFNANPVSGLPEAGAQPIVINLNVQGNIMGTQEFVDKTLIPAIKDAVDNREFVIIGNGSRQAANLTSG